MRRPPPWRGGTNLIVDLRAKRERPDRIVGLGEVAELKGMEFGEDRISIGGATTVSDLLHSAEIAEAAPSLAESARLFAGLMVRNTATVAGNIACGSPAADLVPPLLSLDADVTLASAAAARTVPLDEYFLGYRRDVRRPDELITRVSWPRLPGRCVNTFYKLARRKGDAITVTGVAVTIVAAGGICTRARIALGAVAPVVLRAKEAEHGLEGRPLTPASHRRGRRGGRRRREPDRRPAGLGRVPAPHGRGARAAPRVAGPGPACLTKGGERCPTIGPLRFASTAATNARPCPPTARFWRPSGRSVTAR